MVPSLGIATSRALRRVVRTDAGVRVLRRPRATEARAGEGHERAGAQPLHREHPGGNRTRAVCQPSGGPFGTCDFTLSAVPAPS